MRIAVVSARFPEAGAKGDQSRMYSFVEALAARHAITVLTSARPSSAAHAEALARHARVVALPAGAPVRVTSTLAALASGTPGQVGWMMPPRAWRAACREAADHDVVLVNTVRSFRSALPRPAVVDHVDALSLNMERRARGPERLPVRLAAGLEARLLRRHERRAARWATAQLATSPEDAAHLPGDVTVIPVSWSGPLTAADAHERDLDVILTGNMRYPPNRDAAAWFAHDIVPAVRRRHGAASATIAGRAANSLDLQGVRIASDVQDLHAYLRRARVAVIPLRIGTGSPFKLLEAVACGAAVVATPWAASRFTIPCATASDGEGLGNAVADLLDDDDRRRAAVAAAQEALARHTAEAAAAKLERVLLAAARR